MKIFIKNYTLLMELFKNLIYRDLINHEINVFNEIQLQKS